MKNEPNTLKERIELLNEKEKMILKTIAQIHYLPRNSFYMVSAYPELKPEWKYNKAIKNLKARGFLESVGIDCNKGHNEKDAHVLTRRGCAACKELGYELNPNWSEMTRYPKHYLRSTICDCFLKAFTKAREQRIGFCSTEKLYEIEKEKNGNNLNLRGLSTSGILIGHKDVFSMYYVNNYNYTILWEKEITAARIVKEIVFKNGFFNNKKLNRLFILSDVKSIDCLLGTKVGAKWFKMKNDEFKRYDSRIKSALYYYNENQLIRGSAYVLSFESYQDLELYLSPERSEQHSDEYLIRRYENSPLVERFPIVENKKYGFSLYETEQLVVFNLTIQELHKISRILNVLKDGEEKRLIRIITTENQKELSEKTFQGYDCKVLVLNKEKFFPYD